MCCLAVKMFKLVDLSLLIAALLSSLCILNCLDCTTEGDVRLVAGNHQYEGRLEVCLYRPEFNMTLWSTFCTSGWGINETLVVCRQLGVLENETLAVFGISFIGERSSTSIRWANANCIGNENHITDCFYDGGTCSSGEDVGMICAQPNPECTDGDVRIIDAFSNVASEGRVEVCRGHRWGTVCNAEWDDTDAAVVCKQLNLSQANSPMAIRQGPPARDSVPINLDFVHCNDDSLRLLDCPALVHVQGCTHAHDAGIKCGPSFECTIEGSIQLVQGNGLSEGRVEYCRDSLWVSVCMDSWNHYDAQVVCRQLGFLGASLGQTSTSNLPEEQFFRNFLKTAHCFGNETTLSECSFDDRCSLGPGARVKCYNESICPNNLDVRLVDGVLSDEMGTIELCFGDWGYVCGTSWDHTDAQVLCRQLGFTGGRGFPSSPFNSKEGNFNVANVRCTESDTSITECSHDGYIEQSKCSASVKKQAAVICGTTAESVPSKCSNDQLKKGISTNETSLQVGSYGTCEHYQGLSSMCNTIFNNESHDKLYVFIKSERFNQSWLSYKLDQILSTNILEEANSGCSSMIKWLLCNYFLPPCGINQTVYVPRAVCPEQCSLVRDSCTKIWDRITIVLTVNENLGGIDCNTSQDNISPLPTCCVDLPDIGAPGTSTPSEEPSLPAPANQDIMTVAIVMSLLGLLIIVVVVIVFAILYVISSKRKKVTLRKLQLDILASASTRSSYARSPQYLSVDDSGMLLHSTNGSMKGPLAVPNPYSTKVDLQPSPLLGVTNSSMASRISSSIIRELTSNLLIPHTRLKLLDCVGHGGLIGAYVIEDSSMNILYQ